MLHGGTVPIKRQLRQRLGRGIDASAGGIYTLTKFAQLRPKS